MSLIFAEKNILKILVCGKNATAYEKLFKFINIFTTRKSKKNQDLGEI